MTTPGVTDQVSLGLAELVEQLRQLEPPRRRLSVARKIDCDAGAEVCERLELAGPHGVIEAATVHENGQRTASSYHAV